MDTQIKILVLDDNVDVAEGLAEMLMLSGYAVTTVHDAMSAVRAYEAEHFDFGFLDVRMPGMNGFEAFLQIKNNHPEARIVLMTGYADEELVSKTVQNGAAGLLCKPFEPDDMLAKINECFPKELVPALSNVVHLAAVVERAA